MRRTFLKPEAAGQGTEAPTVHDSADGIGRSWIWIAAAFFAVICLTKAFYWGDTIYYTASILRYAGKPLFAIGNQLWEFGHLLWRPYGWTWLTVMTPLAGGRWTPAAITSFGFYWVAVLTTFITVVLWYRIAVEISGSRLVGFIVAFGFGCSNAYLNYSQSGAPYVPGLCCLSYSIWILMQGKKGAISTKHAWISAMLAAFAATVWIPYLLTAPGLLFLALWPAQSKRFNVAFAIRWAVMYSVCLAVAFGFGTWIRGVRSVADARAWISDSGHGVQPRSPIRLAMGVPREFLYLGGDSVFYKRFLRKDPYAPVSMADLIKASLWKLAAFWLFMACVGWELLRSRPGRWNLWLLAVGWTPILLVALFLFETASPERYFPAILFLFLAVAWALRDFPQSRRVTQYGIVAFLGCMVVTNTYAMYRPHIDNEDAPSRERLMTLKPHLSGMEPTVVILTNQDHIDRLYYQSPFETLPAVHLYDVIEPESGRMDTWRRDTAQWILGVWSKGNQVWASKRFWQPRPLPEWEWVEGDDPRATWPDVVNFFSPLKIAEDEGGIDGFYRLEATPENAASLEAYAESAR